MHHEDIILRTILFLAPSLAILSASGCHEASDKALPYFCLAASANGGLKLCARINLSLFKLYVSGVLSQQWKVDQYTVHTPFVQMDGCYLVFQMLYLLLSLLPIDKLVLRYTLKIAHASQKFTI